MSLGYIVYINRFVQAIYTMHCIVLLFHMPLNIFINRYVFVYMRVDPNNEHLDIELELYLHYGITFSHMFSLLHYQNILGKRIELSAPYAGQFIHPHSYIYGSQIVLRPYLFQLWTVKMYGLRL
jgi:hypothetical protein